MTYIKHFILPACGKFGEDFLIVHFDWLIAISLLFQPVTFSQLRYVPVQLFVSANLVAYNVNRFSL